MPGGQWDGRPVDLHALANMPGAGRAFDALDQLGAIGEDPRAPVWEVQIRGRQPVEAVISPRAWSRAEAMQQAGRLVTKGQVEWRNTDHVAIDWTGTTAFCSDQERS